MSVMKWEYFWVFSVCLWSIFATRGTVSSKIFRTFLSSSMITMSGLRLVMVMVVANVADITDMFNCQYKVTASLGYYWEKTIVAFIWDVMAFRISTKRSPMQIVHETIFIFDVPCGQPKSSNFCEENTSKSHLNCIYREEVAPSSGAFLDKI